MKISNLNLYSYNLNLRYPIYFNHQQINKRQGFLIGITDKEGQTFFSEVSPLPFYSVETYDQIIDSFRHIKSKLMGSFWSIKLLLNEKNLLMDLLSPNKHPSLYFGLEFALLSFILPKVPILNDIKINMLLSGSDSEILEKVKLNKRHPAYKLKIGNRSPDAVLELIQHIKCFLGSSVKLRIDFNRRWNLDDTLYFCNLLPLKNCEYLEEPLEDPEELKFLAEQVPHPLAFDESLIDMPLDYLLSIPTKKAFIVKPSLIGSQRRIINLYQQALKHHMSFILTSCFESGLGHLMIAHLAHFLGLSEPIGLDTYTWLEEDLLQDKLDMSEGLLKLKQFPLDRSIINPNKLQLIDA